MRKKIIAGNWKMYYSPLAAVDFINKNKAAFESDVSDVVLCVSYINLHPVMEALSGTSIKVGAQNMHYRDEGAYTGEVSGAMLKEMRVPYVILGHSERRASFGESDTTVNLKILKAVEHNITPIICVGESQKQRKDGIMADLLRRQITIAFLDVPAEAAAKLVIAYEPIWAIGTGETATTEQAEEACKIIRGVIAEQYNQQTADAIRILYGGSVNDANAAELFAMPNIDGGLVGGASIKPAFETIIKAAK